MFRGITGYKVVAFEDKLCLVYSTNIVGTFVDTVKSTPYYAACTTMKWMKHVEEKIQLIWLTIKIVELVEKEIDCLCVNSR